MRRKSSLAAQISSCQPVSQGPSDWFCSSDTCHPVSSLPEVCFLSPLSPYKDWGLGLTGYCYIPTYLFPSLSLPLPPHKCWWDKFFSEQKQNSFRSLRGKKVLDSEMIFMLTWRVSCPRGVRYNTVNCSVIVKKSRNVMITLHNRLNVIVVKTFRGAPKKLLLSICTVCVCYTVRQQFIFLALCSNILQDQL